VKRLEKKQIEDLTALVELVEALLKGALHIGENSGKLQLGFGFLERLKKDLKSGKLFLEDLPKVSKKGVGRDGEEKKGNSPKKDAKKDANRAKSA